MHSDGSLTEITLVVVAALLGGLGFARLKQPPIIGYILAGVILGPSGFKLVQHRESVNVLAELGVLLLLFGLGMELSIRTFKRVWFVATFCVLLQIIFSLVVTFAFASLFNWSTGLSILFGFVVAMSSTAVVVKVLESMGELKTEIGQISIGILIAQDLAIVPMILVLKNLGQGESLLNLEMFFKIAISLGLIIALIIYLGRRQRVRLPLTALIAGEVELTPLASLTFCFAAAAISGLLDLSPAYGAFLAGLVLGNTNERLIMMETVQPIQSILMMVFFLSIGLLLNSSFIFEHLGMVIFLLIFITIGKTIMNILILRLLRLSWSQSFFVGALVGQLGEFAFLLATVAHQNKIINDYGENLIITVTVLSLSFSPLWLTIVRRVQLFTDNQHMTFGALLDKILGIDLFRFKNLLSRIFLKSKKHHNVYKQIEPSLPFEESLNLNDKQDDAKPNH